MHNLGLEIIKVLIAGQGHFIQVQRTQICLLKGTKAKFNVNVNYTAKVLFLRD